MSLREFTSNDRGSFPPNNRSKKDLPSGLALAARRGSGEGLLFMAATLLRRLCGVGLLLVLLTLAFARVGCGGGVGLLLVLTFTFARVGCGGGVGLFLLVFSRRGGGVSSLLLLFSIAEFVGLLFARRATRCLFFVRFASSIGSEIFMSRSFE